MVRRSTSNVSKASTPARRTTTVTFTAEELTALGRVVAAGQVMLQTTYPMIGKLKAAMSRLGVVKAQGL